MKFTKQTYEDLLVAEGEANREETVDHKDFMREVRARRNRRTRKQERVAV